MKFFCIGDQDTVTGFRFAGIEGVIVAGADQARQALQAAVDQADAGVIIIPDPLAVELQSEINAIRFSRPSPAIVEIPGPKGLSPGRPTLIDMVRDAVGVRL